MDTKAEQLIYPEDQKLVINERQTCNFKAPENFVVFECVHRLLLKGYQARHLELEPKWKVGHGGSGGRADILVKDNAEKELLLIECKTAGREFDRAWKDTLLDGGQLFGYVEQVRATQFLCLYASDFDDGNLFYRSHIIAHRDNLDYLKLNPLLKSFGTADKREERFAVWRDTYKHDFRTAGIFEDNIQPYHIGKDKYSLADLKPIAASDQQKKYHEFATILRQHNVSGRENAFDKLVNLFLCKLVDENENPTDLKFYWKGVAYDTHFDLLDRLQQLYHAGMKKFLGEDITYINEGDVNNALRFIRQNPDATQRAVWNLFIQQKFFTNNDFSFIDVHNEKLFYQNADVLLKILQMWQDIRLVGDQQNQFLGDMFEGFLDQGVKQSEGQFFTPIPICRFLLMSLPLETLVKDSPNPPRAIDYACGAGHFLTELALQLKPLAQRYHSKRDLKEFYGEIFGIEKEYRLSKIAKVSAFMYNQPTINVCYGDGLVEQHDAYPQIQNGQFDLLVANPPFSVRGFLETLPETERENYTLTKTIDRFDTANSIETFFLERARQLLKPGGVAAIILPSSILSNGGAAYVRAREILLQSFDIVAIAELAGGTFGKTGTNTVTLFLRRKSSNPEAADHFRERVNDWFFHDPNQPVYADEHLLDGYALHIGAALADYKTLLAGTPNTALLAHDTFAQYRRTFEASSEVKNLNAQKSFKAKTPAEREAELFKRFVEFAAGVERDKLLHFILASEQPNKVLLVKSPTETALKRKFLGYEWSAAKGDEGIKLIKDAQGRHLTPLYDETDRDNPAKVNAAIAQNFNGTLQTPPPALEEFVSLVALPDLLDFGRVSFEKTIALAPKKVVAVQSKWPLKSVAELAQIISGGTPDTTNASYWDGEIPWLSVADFGKVTRFVFTAEKHITQAGLQNSSTKLLQPDDLIISARGTVGALAQLTAPMAFNQSCYGLRSKGEVSNAYLFYVLKREIQQLKAQATGSKFDAITIQTFEDAKLPVADLPTQHQIVAECEVVDTEVEAAAAELEAVWSEIEAAIADVQSQNFPSKPLETLCEIKRGRFSHRPRNDPRFFDGPYPFIQTGDVVRATGGKISYSQTLNEDGLGVSKLFQPPVVLVTIAANIGDTAVLDYPACFTDSVVGLMPFSEVDARFLELMMRTHKKQLNDEAPQMAQKNINVEILRPLKIPVPPLSVQAELVAQIEALEARRVAAQAIFDGAPARKAAILEKYL